jgi:hypothetical protein
VRNASLIAPMRAPNLDRDFNFFQDTPALPESSQDLDGHRSIRAAMLFEY